MLVCVDGHHVDQQCMERAASAAHCASAAADAVLGASPTHISFAVFVPRRLGTVGTGRQHFANTGAADAELCCGWYAVFSVGVCC